MRIVEKPINKAAGIAKLAMIVASLIPYMVKLRNFLRKEDRISPTVPRSILITLLNTPLTMSSSRSTFPRLMFG